MNTADHGVENKNNNCSPGFLESGNTEKKLELLMKNGGLSVFEYFPDEDRMILYNERLQREKEIFHCFSEQEEDEDFMAVWKIKEFLCSCKEGTIEVANSEPDGSEIRQIVDIMTTVDEETQELCRIGCVKDVTEEKIREEILKERASRDSLTGLYNRFTGIEKITQYLRTKNPYTSCGMIVLDVDCFKKINDSYGHLFGDKVLEMLAQILKNTFQDENVLMRAGGDEFVILVKNVTHGMLVQKAMHLIKAVRRLYYPEYNYRVTCSAGVCFLPENISGYTYEQLFENADWALYQAKINGRDRYEFCDNLKRFMIEPRKQDIRNSNIDPRYFHNDVVSTAFEIFEKMNSFDEALKLLMEIMGICFQLDRITVIQTNIKEKDTRRQYQWTSSGAPEVLEQPGSFTKEDFLTLFQSYDEYGTSVLQYDNLDMYSPQARELLVQGNAKTVLYAAMYCEGKYTGAISYVVCTEKRYWSKESRSQLGEVTKLISVHLAKNHALNASYTGVLAMPEYDSLTGLLSFYRFREELERIIVGNRAVSGFVIYTDFENFKFFNQKYGYRNGDILLKEFSNDMVQLLESIPQSYFTRIVSDQFIVVCTPDSTGEEIKEEIEEVCSQFVEKQKEHFANSSLRIRAGIYEIREDCFSASEAIDMANYARKQIKGGKESQALLYSKEISRKRRMEQEIITGMDEALKKHEFQIYLQPKVSLKDYSIVGAEALVRWIKPDGTILYPDSFIPLYEENERILELDMYIFEEVIKFLRKNQDLGRKQVPISINLSALHAMDNQIVEKYQELLQKYEVSSALTEVELTETAMVAHYDNMKQLLQNFRDAGAHTSLDDFAAGYSVLNSIIDIPVDTVKIDRAVIHHCESSVRGRFFLQQLIQLGYGLGYNVLCEGIEQENQAEIVKEAGCEIAQGYWFYKPMTVSEYEKIMYKEEYN